MNDAGDILGGMPGLVQMTNGVIPGLHLLGCAFALAVLGMHRRPAVRTLAKWTVAAQLMVLPVLFLSLPLAGFGGGAWLALPGMACAVIGPVMSVLLFLALIKARSGRGNLMWNVSLILAAGLIPAACSPPSAKNETSPSEKVSAANPASDADAGAPVVLNAADLRGVCRAGLAAIHGQGLSAIEIDGLEGQVVNASWRAPVDGGRRRAQCRVEGDIITWKPVGATNPEQDRWMNQSGDPVTRFVLDGEAITINTTLPDGTTATETYALTSGERSA